LPLTLADDERIDLAAEIARRQRIATVFERQIGKSSSVYWRRLDCIDFCATCASFMLRDSPAHHRVCEICAEVCDACAVSCERFPDDKVVNECAKECRGCAESCRKMASA
jgi:hypothetical protein